MDRIFTIGFTQKTAQTFFELLKSNNVDIVLDIRLNNTSQLAGFAKYPDIKYFLKEISNIEYIHDLTFSPEESTLSKYKKKAIDWNEYVNEFTDTMQKRNVAKHIHDKYQTDKSICLLCSEPTAKECHRGIVAQYFVENFKDIKTIHL